MRSFELLVLTNTERLAPDYPSRDKLIVSESVILFFGFPSVQIEQTYHLQPTNLIFDNNPILRLAGLIEGEETFFSVREHETRTRVQHKHDPNTRLSIRFQVSSDRHVVIYRLFSFFDLLAQVGGLSIALTMLAAAANNFFNFQAGDNHLVQRLYKTKPSKDFPVVKAQEGFREYLQSCLPSCLVCDCLIHKKKDEFFAKGRTQLAKELDIVQLLRKVRFYDQAMKKLLEEATFRQIGNQTEQEPIELDKEDEKANKDRQSARQSSKPKQKPIKV